MTALGSTASPAPGRRPRPVVRTPAAFGAVYKLVLRSQITVGRIFAVVALGGLGVLLGVAVGLGATQIDPVTDGARFINGYGLVVLAPVVCLVFASSALGDLVDDKTLVYLWLRPVNRLLVAGGAAAATLTICLPSVVVPLVVAASLSGGGTDLVSGTVVAGLVGVVGYVGMFLALGLRFKRALVWGLAYILLWEGFVANASDTAGKLSLRAYTRSVLSEYTGVGFSQASLSLTVAVVVPIVVGVVFVVLTGRRLARTPVD